jgi:hypothetical protein
MAIYETNRPGALNLKPMITITRDGTEVVVTMETGCSTVKALSMRFDTNNQLYAELLTDQLRAKLANLVEDLRRNEYERGYRDKTKRKPKSTWMPRTLAYIHGKS